MVIIVVKVFLLDLLAYSDKGSLVNNSLIQDSIEMGDVIVKCTKHQYTKSFIHNILLHYVLTWWLALSHLDALLVLKNPYSVMVCSSMLTKTFSAPESFFALITRKNNAFQMVSFNVIFYGVSFPFFPTHFTLVRFSSGQSSGILWKKQND